MLESAEIGHKIAKQTYTREEPKLREALINAQYDLGQAGLRGVVALISGVEAGGRGETATKLTEWMDPRHIRVYAFGPRTPEERSRPLAWRYWRALPAKGKVAIFMNAWYSEALAGHLEGRLDAARLDHYLESIRDYERMLTREGVLVVKFWIHLAKKDQKERLAKLDHDRRTTWRVTKRDWALYRLYSKSHDLWEHTLRETATDVAPWYVVEGVDERYRNLTVGKILLEAMQRGALAVAPDRARQSLSRNAPPAPSVIDNVKLIRDLDLSKQLTKKTFDRELEKYQGKLATLTQHKRFRKHALVLVFEGADAAGKGGAIRRVVGALDPRQYEIVPIAAPTDEERAHPYLWRFWRHVPPLGRAAIFDRSWYGRVLVERVEGFAAEADWMRAYGEINGFEEELTTAGTVVCKFWLQISKNEQLRRFKEREHEAFKRFKITPDDWRNRKRWNDYERAICDMVDRTSTEIAPWTLVEAEDKYYARIKIMRTIVERLQRALQ
jgi:AMP-polyphosphate phosphotransferase